jgi:hypothetical protein
MDDSHANPELSDTILEVGRKVHPRLYRRFKDLRPWLAAADWAQTLDCRTNPYDRFLLRREILHHVESECWNYYSLASREEIAAETDRLIDEFPGGDEPPGVFSYVFRNLFLYRLLKHPETKRNRLDEALAKLPAKQRLQE